MNLTASKLPTSPIHHREALARRCDIDALFAQFNASVSDEIDEIIALRDTGVSPIPEVSFEQLNKVGFTATQAALVRKRGCVIVRETFGQSQATLWDQELADYLGGVNQYQQQLESDIDSGDLDRAVNPHMLAIYWSKTQLEIRQSTQLHRLRQRLNSLWRVTDKGVGAFDPNRSCTYADRVRIRQPRDQINGLDPHVDSCSMESWFCQDRIERSYATLLSGNWRAFDAFDAVGRVNTNQKPHDDSCGMFRTYQGWMALTPQGPDSGTLQLVPSSRCVAWMFLKMLSDCLHKDEAVYPLPCEAYMLHSERHALLTNGLCSLPELQPGDTVWWHPDAVHGVEQNNRSSQNSSVIYLGIAPDCERNRAYLANQKASFVNGLSPPDFPATHAEKNFVNRALPKHLNKLGAQQMGFQS